MNFCFTLFDTVEPYISDTKRNFLIIIANKLNVITEIENCKVDAHTCMFAVLHQITKLLLHLLPYFFQISFPKSHMTLTCVKWHFMVSK